MSLTTEIKPKPDNSFRPLITGWRLWLRCALMGGVEAWENESFIISYRDPAFPACPECGSPNVRLLRRNSYWCLDCKSRDTCVVEGSTGIERRRALIRLWAILLVTLGIMAVYLALVLLGHAG